MQAKDYNLLDFISKKDETFIVPAYQRKYKWTFKNEIKEFLEDLIVFEKEISRKDFFFGSIVIKKSNDFNSKIILVDGQQRITTILLILSVLKDKLKNKNVDIKARINMNLETEEGKIKLERLKDQEILKNIIEGKLKLIDSTRGKESNYFKIFNEIKKYFSKKSIIEIETFYYKMLSHIKVAIIMLNQDEDEFLVFESINSKGQSLSSSDLIKNYCLMNLDEKFHSIYENEIIEFLGIDIDDFNRQIIAIRSGELTTKTTKKMYLKFKEIFKAKDINETFIDEFKKHCAIWMYIKNTNFGLKSLPFKNASFLNFYNILHAMIYKNSTLLNEKLKLNDNFDVDLVVNQIAEISLKRALINFGRSEANRKFAKISNEIFKSNNVSNYDFNHICIKKLKESNKSYRIPTWEEIRETIMKYDVYTQHKKTLKCALIAYESKLSQQDFNMEKINIEHIFPENPSDEWGDYDEKMNDALNTLGNISIVNSKINSVMGNKLFNDKKRILEERSYLKINKWVYEQDDWNYKSIEKRANLILDEFEKMWNKI